MSIKIEYSEGTKREYHVCDGCGRRKFEPSIFPASGTTPRGWTHVDVKRPGHRLRKLFCQACRPQPLKCACCGSATTGRHWWNRDAGYGLCKGCIDFVSSGETTESMRESYGERGVHYDIEGEEA